ncbi:hypothetical protein FQZ97_762660 [compost metagenome]
MPHDVGELLERDIDGHYTTLVPKLIGDTAYGAHQHHIVGLPVIGFGAQCLTGLSHGALVPRAAARVVAPQTAIDRPDAVSTLLGAQSQVGIGRMASRQAGEQLTHRPILLTLGNLSRIGAGVALEICIDGFQHGMVGEVVDVLRNALEVELHRIVDLTDLTAAAVEKRLPRVVAQIEDHQQRDQDHGEAGDRSECQGEFVLDVHPLSLKGLVLLEKCFPCCAGWPSGLCRAPRSGRRQARTLGLRAAVHQDRESRLVDVCGLCL